MRRSTLDKFFVAGGLVLAVLLFALGVVLKQNANFAHDYVHNQLAAQKITFTPKAGLAPAELKAVVPGRQRREAARLRQAGRVLREQVHRGAPRRR